MLLWIFDDGEDEEKFCQLYEEVVKNVKYTRLQLQFEEHLWQKESGIIGGIFFASVMVLFIVIWSARKDKLRERYGIEGTVLYDGAENHMVNKEAVGYE